MSASIGFGPTIWVEEPEIVSAIPSALRPEFPDRPLRITPDPYGGEVDPDGFFAMRNSCDGEPDCPSHGIDYGEDMVVFRTRVDGCVYVYCPRCFCKDYARMWWLKPGDSPTGMRKLEEKFDYLMVREDGRYYRWTAPA